MWKEGAQGLVEELSVFSRILLVFPSVTTVSRQEEETFSPFLPPPPEVSGSFPPWPVLSPGKAVYFFISLMESAQGEEGENGCWVVICSVCLCLGWLCDSNHSANMAPRAEG